jgi:hypothetical protein
MLCEEDVFNKKLVSTKRNFTRAAGLKAGAFLLIATGFIIEHSKFSGRKNNGYLKTTVPNTVNVNRHQKEVFMKVVSGCRLWSEKNDVFKMRYHCSSPWLNSFFKTMITSFGLD